MDLFSQNSPYSGQQPLAERVRPDRIEDFFGQEASLGISSPLRKIIEKNKMVPNLILWGPPGSGKTTFAKLLEGLVVAEFIQVNAVDTGTKKLKEIGQAARERKLQFGRPTVLFVDEIHRFNRAQQDVLLPFAEKGDFSLVGATTENPSYELNSALLSRCRVVVFESLSQENLKALMKRAQEKINFKLDNFLSTEAQTAILSMASGDGRKLLNICEQVMQYLLAENFSGTLDVEALSQVVESGMAYYDKAGDEHYNCISAFIKSIRGSDPDAGLYYLARMIKGGEDPVFIARRLVILASEDIGNADPRALTIAVAGLQAVELVGLPEGAINLAQVTTYLASAPKSNRSYLALKKAMQVVDDHGRLPVPKSLRSAQSKLTKSLGYGKDYKYSHQGETGWVEQDFLPEAIRDSKFYEPTERGFEKNITNYLKWMKGEL